MTVSPPFTLAAFGLSLRTHTKPPGAWAAQPSSKPSLEIREVPTQSIAQSWSGVAGVGWQGTIEGAPFVVERGVAGDHRFVHGSPPDADGTPAPETRAVHHLDADSGLLQCAPTDPSDLLWWRIVLDSVLFTVALMEGYEALHAGALATPGGAVAITATTGGGKSTLLSETLTRGFHLMADDVLVLEHVDGEAPTAHPGPPLMNVPDERVAALHQRVSAQSICTLEGKCSLEGEQWLAVPVHSDAVPLRALVVLDRQPGLTTSMQPIEEPLGALLGSLIDYPRSPERRRARFELAGTLASTVALWHLRADSQTPASVLADVLLAEVC